MLYPRKKSFTSSQVVSSGTFVRLTYSFPSGSTHSVSDTMLWACVALSDLVWHCKRPKPFPCNFASASDGFFRGTYQETTSRELFNRTLSGSWLAKATPFSDKNLRTSKGNTALGRSDNSIHFVPGICKGTSSLSTPSWAVESVWASAASPLSSSSSSSLLSDMASSLSICSSDDPVPSPSLSLPSSGPEANERCQPTPWLHPWSSLPMGQDLCMRWQTTRRSPPLGTFLKPCKVDASLITREAALPTSLALILPPSRHLLSSSPSIQAENKPNAQCPMPLSVSQ
mmetsp:Transcript_12869/g.36081  ORF Transcript_12869/g.36081 Transcript_12869/m.36081 type:complete len:285 (-) Transcript_12869:329-1183(-)